MQLYVTNAPLADSVVVVSCAYELVERKTQVSYDELFTALHRVPTGSVTEEGAVTRISNNVSK